MLIALRVRLVSVGSLALALALALATVGPARAQPADAPPAIAAPTPAGFRVDRILVKPAPAADLSALHAQQRTKLLRSFPEIGNLQVLQLAGDASLDRVLAAYRESTLVQYAE